MAMPVMAVSRVCLIFNPRCSRHHDDDDDGGAYAHDRNSHDHDPNVHRQDANDVLE